MINTQAASIKTVTSWVLTTAPSTRTLPSRDLIYLADRIILINITTVAIHQETANSLPTPQMRALIVPRLRQKTVSVEVQVSSAQILPHKMAQKLFLSPINIWRSYGARPWLPYISRRFNTWMIISLEITWILRLYLISNVLKIRWIRKQF